MWQLAQQARNGKEDKTQTCSAVLEYMLQDSWYFIADIKPGCAERRENMANVEHLPLTETQATRDTAVIL